MYKDRGIIKWAPFDALVGFHGEIAKMIYNQNKIEQPILAEDRLYEMDLTIKEAINFNKELQIDYYEDGYIKTIVDYVLKIDLYEQKVILKSRYSLDLSSIINLIVYG